MVFFLPSPSRQSLHFKVIIAHLENIPKLGQQKLRARKTAYACYWKSAKPSSFTDVKGLPCHVFVNRSRRDGSLSNEWVTEMDRKITDQERKITLIIDNPYSFHYWCISKNRSDLFSTLFHVEKAANRSKSFWKTPKNQYLSYFLEAYLKPCENLWWSFLRKKLTAFTVNYLVIKVPSQRYDPRSKHNRWKSEWSGQQASVTSINGAGRYGGSLNSPTGP